MIVLLCNNLVIFPLAMFPGSPVFTVCSPKQLMGPFCHAMNIRYYIILEGDPTLIVQGNYSPGDTCPSAKCRVLFPWISCIKQLELSQGSPRMRKLAWSMAQKGMNQRLNLVQKYLVQIFFVSVKFCQKKFCHTYYDPNEFLDP